MVDVLQITLAIAVIVIVGVSVYAAARWGVFRPNDTNEQSGEERHELSVQDRRKQFRIPLRGRYKAYPLPYRLALTAILGLVGLFVFLTHQMLRVGADPTSYLTVETYIVGAAFGGIIAGVRVKQWSDRRVQWLTVIYDDEVGDEVVERIPYMDSRTSVSDGQPIIKECHKQRFLGLFWRFRQIAERRELRGARKIPEDVIEHQIPEHAVTVPSGYVVQTSPDGDRVIEGPGNPEITYKSQNQLSNERAQQIRRKNNQLQTRMDATQAENAELQRELDRMYEKVQNREYNEREDFKQDWLTVLNSAQGIAGGPAPGAGGGQLGPGDVEPGDDQQDGSGGESR
ncbi:hypothetical protein C478_07322 [Natrinema thermotolerans DSM 11552]|nr:hypothetical protein C478_07322 [Natrinema thermotolerans DSM 11552]